MRYESAKTPMGNVGVSCESQAAADAQAAAMDAGNNRDCTGCSDCSCCSCCSDCSDCSGILKWRGGNASKLLTTNGLRWPVVTDGKKIQIGCKCHAIAEWDEFDDKRIGGMHPDALAFWHEHKATILALAATRAKMEG